MALQPVFLATAAVLTEPSPILGTQEGLEHEHTDTAITQVLMVWLEALSHHLVGDLVKAPRHRSTCGNKEAVVFTLAPVLLAPVVHLITPAIHRYQCHLKNKKMDIGQWFAWTVHDLENLTTQLMEQLHSREEQASRPLVSPILVVAQLSTLLKFHPRRLR